MDGSGYELGKCITEFYDLTPKYSERSDIRFYLDRCKETNGSILELGCGTGRVLIPAAQHGAKVTGLDLSEGMLQQCRDKIQKEPAELQDRVNLVLGDMTNFSLKSKFDLIIIPFRPFQHLISIDDQISCLNCIRDHLASGGKLIFDVFQVNMSFMSRDADGNEVEDSPETELPDGRELRRCYRIKTTHRAEQYNDVELIYYLTDQDGKRNRLVEEFPMRYYFRYEVVHLLARCGFIVSELYGDFDLSPLTNDSPEMIFVAKAE